MGGTHDLGRLHIQALSYIGWHAVHLVGQEAIQNIALGPQGEVRTSTAGLTPSLPNANITSHANLMGSKTFYPLRCSAYAYPRT